MRYKLPKKQILQSATALGVFASANQAHELYKNLKIQYDNRFMYTATIDNDGYVYRDFLEWLESEVSPRSLTWLSYYDGLKRQFDNTVGQNVYFDGHRVNVSIEKEGDAKDAFGDSISKHTVHFKTTSKAGIDAVERLLTHLSEKKKVKQRETCLYTPHRHGWGNGDLPKRVIDSVFLAPGVKESLVDDLQNFFDSEDHYSRIGAPWHRGYLLYGEPGNGKSSIASAVANKFSLNLYSLPLSSVENDSVLSALINDMQERSVLLIEDIDIFSNSTGRTQSDTGPTLAGLLNALDGVGTPHGLLTFVTTNHVENLDPALIRAGRTDYRVELKAPVDEQIKELFFYAYGESLGATPKQFKNMADVANILKTNVTDADKARRELSE